jgi:enterochelin esterase family protein
MRKILIAIAAVMVGGAAMAQQALWGGQPIVSPEIHKDGSVTFRYQAPESVAKVEITGDFLPTMAREIPGYGSYDAPGVVELTKDDKGVWSYTSAPLEGELYSYSFIVDGISMKDPNNVYLIRDVASVTNVFIVPGGQGDLYSVQDVPHGTVARRWYDSPTLDMQRRITIYTPPGYETSKAKYPVLYLNHGAGGDEEAWIALGRTAQILDNLIAEGKAAPMLVVMSNGNAWQKAAPGEDEEGMYKPSFMGQRAIMQGQFEPSYADIIKFVESNYRVIKKKSGRAIAGLSMGGFHSLHVSRIMPNTFDYVGLFSAAIMPGENVKSATYADIDGTLAAQRDNGFKLYWIACGNTDFLWQANLDYAKKLDAMNFPYTFRESEGGHIWKNWRIYLGEFVPMLFK